MKSSCERFEYVPEIGIKDSLSGRFISLSGDIIQIKGFKEVQFSESTKILVNRFIEQIKPLAKGLDDEAKQKRLKSNFFVEFNRNLNEGYSE